MAGRMSSESAAIELPAAGQADDVRAELMAHYRRLFTYARLLVQDESTAEDLVQDTMERALRARGSFQAGTNAGAWLNRIMKNLFTDHYRHKVAVREISLDKVDCWLAAEEPQEPDCLDVVSSSDVLAGLAELDARLREIFVLRYVEHASYQKIARRFQIELSTVGTRLHRARKRLRRILEQRLARDRGAVVISLAERTDARRRDADSTAATSLAVLGA